MLSNGNGFLQRDTGGFFLQLFFCLADKKKKMLESTEQQERGLLQIYLSDPLSYEGKTA